MSREIGVNGFAFVAFFFSTPLPTPRRSLHSNPVPPRPFSPESVHWLLAGKQYFLGRVAIGTKRSVPSPLGPKKQILIEVLATSKIPTFEKNG